MNALSEAVHPTQKQGRKTLKTQHAEVAPAMFTERKGKGENMRDKNTKLNVHVLPPSDNPLFTAIVMMYEIARSRGIDPGIDEDLVRRLHKAAYKTEGNVAVPVSIREGGNVINFIVHISDNGVNLETNPDVA
jgi:hypothetical protein